ncbi:MAG: ABC transporter permease [Peptococcaceae bacterium]|nr:ABC transporter permease [Peptococcaceae bacterium]
MNIIKRAMTSITRKPGKTVILLILVFVLGNVIAGAISIRQAVGGTESILRTKMAPVVTIELDSKKVLALQERNPDFSRTSLSVEIIEKLGALPYVKNFDYSIGTTLESRDLKRFGRQTYGAALLTTFRFQGVNDPEIIDLKEGKIKLVSGRVFSKQEISDMSYVALISQNVATINNISVGSKMEFENNISYADSEGNSCLVNLQNFVFEVIGIYEPVKQVRISNYGYEDMSWMDEDMENKVYAPNKALYEINEYSYNEYLRLTGWDYREAIEFTPLFTLKDPLELDTFIEDTAALIPDYFEVTSFTDDFKKVAAPLKSIQDITALVLYVAIAATIIILGLLTTLFLRDRRHEIGTYLAMGERKFRIAAQIGLEVAVVAVIAITLSLFSGYILSGNLSERMLLNQIAAEQAQPEDFSMSTGGGFPWGKIELETRGYQFEISSDDILQSYEVSLDLLTILLFYCVGLSTIGISVLIPIFYMIRLNPKRILM